MKFDLEEISLKNKKNRKDFTMKNILKEKEEQKWRYYLTLKYILGLILDIW